VDVTERKHAERQKNEFLALLAHELRNPLAPICSALHIIGLPEADAALVAQMRQMAERQVWHMARLLDDLLDVVRISQGRFELRQEVIELGATLEGAAESVRPFCAERAHELTVGRPASPLWVQADRTRLEQVLANLLNNAAKYTDPGGRIRLRAEREGAQAVIRVQDTGIGIAPGMLPRIFELFVQAERRLNRSAGGVGIGLSLVKRLVELHGGSVEAFSPGLGQGSEFVVRLPAIPDTDPVRETEEALPMEGDKQGAAQAGLRILVVDDNVDAADGLATMLKIGGHDLRVAHDGPATLAIAEAFRPHVVLLDLGLPGMDGYEVARQLRARPEMQGTHIAAVTGSGQPEDRQRSKGMGFDRHLVKPVDPTLLAQLLAEVTASRSA
jgi:CheY-like chemotaxis protein/two-component sensor histidine kinase